MYLAFFTFLTGIAISTVAIYYSVLGLAGIFAGAVIPIIVMGTILEVSKLVTAWWLKANWSRAPVLLKSYMLIATVVLMLITSMGIFGFLSKAHSDQALPAGDVISKIQVIDEKIAIQQEYIKQARKDMEVLNTQIDRYNELGAVSKGVKVRDQQKAEREQLIDQIDKAQNNITLLREDRAPIAASMRAIEAEVGPIKYIAAFVYGDNPDANILEKAVTWVIITIVFVFDPLAILLLLSSQMSFQWAKEKSSVGEVPVTTSVYVDEPPNVDQIFPEPEAQQQVEQQVDQINKTANKPSPEAHHPDTHSYLNAGFGAFYPNLKPMVHSVEKQISEEITTELQVIEEQIDTTASYTESETSANDSKKINKIGDNYYDIDGKKMSVDVFAYEYPELARSIRQQQFKLQADNIGQPASSSFGTQFPAQAAKGEMFLRVDAVPNRLYKFNGSKWIEVDKTRTDSYSYDEQYIQFLIDKLASGEYDLDQLSTSEQELVAEQLERNNGKT